MLIIIIIILISVKDYFLHLIILKWHFIVNQNYLMIVVYFIELIFNIIILNKVKLIINFFNFSIIKLILII